MNVMLGSRLVTTVALAVAAVAAPLAAQQQQQRQQPQAQPRQDGSLLGTPVAKLSAEPTSLTLKAGETVPLKVTAYDAAGNVVAEPRMRVSGPRHAVRVSRGEVTGLAAGKYEIVATAFAGDSAPPVTLQIPVTITWPAVSRVEITPEPGRLYVGVTLAHDARALHADSTERGDAVLTWRSSSPAIASVDRFGNVTAHRTGAVTISAEIEGVRSEIRHTVVSNPVSSLAIELPENTVRTGDVLHLEAIATRANGQVVGDVPITWSYTYVPDDTIAAPGATGIIDRGMFAAEVPGRYTLLATAGNVSARSVLDVRPRDVRRRISVTGRGSITNVHTSDLWPWSAKDGKDYALVGTWGGDGWAYVFDISDMSSFVKTDSIKVDARVINDVTVSPDGRYGVLSREGASNRVNGVVILDLANPAHPKVAATFDEQLTGGVHNMFATDDYLFAISNGD
jgi:hypothetical protein